MIVDASALVAVIRREPDRAAILRAIAAADTRIMSAATLVEVCLVVDGRRDDALSRELDALLTALDVSVTPFTEAQARIARDAFRRYGKGMGHRAQLNLGDCYAYAASKDLGEPLPFKGDDFRHTDVDPARSQSD